LPSWWAARLAYRGARLVWELQNECDYVEAVACWLPITWQDRGAWGELELAIIYFDHHSYYNLGQWEDAYQITASAHEWGHNLNLEGHWWADQCWYPTLLMGYIDSSHAPCLTGPSALEVDAVVMN